MKIRPFIGALLFCIVVSLPAFGGDVATFVNLGFSPKSDYFMFGFHGWDTDVKNFFAEVYTVEVKQNRFVPNGVLKRTYTGTLSPGIDTAGALYTLLEETGPLTKRYEINHLRQGRIIYILMNGEPPKDVLEFRDFITSHTYGVKMIKQIRGSGESVQSAFYLEVSVTLKTGQKKQYQIGLKDFFRQGIQDYRIRQILVSPDEQHVVFVIETLHYRKEGPSIRYMVETAKLFP